MNVPKVPKKVQQMPYFSEKFHMLLNYFSRSNVKAFKGQKLWSGYHRFLHLNTQIHQPKLIASLCIFYLQFYSESLLEFSILSWYTSRRGFNFIVHA